CHRGSGYCIKYRSLLLRRELILMDYFSSIHVWAALNISRRKPKPRRQFGGHTFFASDFCESPSACFRVLRIFCMCFCNFNCGTLLSTCRRRTCKTLWPWPYICWHDLGSLCNIFT